MSGAGPDGAPYGLYIYDVEDPNTFSNARLTYWIIGDQNASWTNLDGHSSCWRYRGRGASDVKADGLRYRPYTGTYECPITSTNRVVDPDGVERLYLGDFHVQASFTQPSDVCNNVTFWTQRHITIDRDGPNGPEAPQVYTFERRNGSLGPYGGGNRMAHQSLQGEEGAVDESPKAS